MLLGIAVAQIDRLVGNVRGIGRLLLLMALGLVLVAKVLVLHASIALILPALVLGTASAPLFLVPS